MDNPGIYFFHIPKTAGWSVWAFIEQKFPAGKICPWWLWDQLITVRQADLAQWDVFRGHFLSHLEPYLNRPLATFTMLRDPMERSISHYYHVRNAPDHPSYADAQRLSLAEFCVDPGTRHMIENYQANYLAKAPLVPAIAVEGLTADDLARFLMQEKMQFPDRFDNDATLLERARERLTTFAAVGITEDFENSLRRIGNSLHCGEAQPFEPRNVGERPRSTELDNTTLNLIREVTQVDQRLYETACQLTRPGQD
jgi:hypothetical protein